MSDKHSGDQASAISIGDIYFVLFRQKWKILAFSALGVLGAIAMLLAKPAPYQSEAKVRIKFELDASGPPGSETKIRSIEDSPASVIATEIETLKSWDSMLMVATNLTPARILGKPELAGEFEQAAAMVRDNLTAEAPTRGSVLTITFQHPDRTLVQSGLSEIIMAYDKRHADMNQPMRMSAADFAKETNRLRDEIAATAAELKDAKARAGVTSLVEDKKALIEQSSQVTKDLFTAKADLASHEGVPDKPVAGAEETNSVVSAATNAPPALPAELVEDYQTKRSMLSSIKVYRDELQYLRGYGPMHPEVLSKSNQIETLRGQIAAMEKEHPELPRLAAPAPGPASSAPGTAVDPGAEQRYVETLHKKVDYLNSQLAQIREAQRKIEEWESPIRELEQRRDRQEADLNYFLSHYDQSTLGNGFNNNQEAVSLMSSPTPPVKKWAKSFQKKVAMIGLGGIFAGLALAFLIEFVLDRSVKRPVEIEGRLRLPLFISIPDVNHNGHRKAARSNGGDRLLLRDVEAGNGAVIVANGNGAAKGGKIEIAPWDRRHALHRFYEGLRDRLIVYFEVRNLVHKPKLVAVTSCGKGAGVSTIAAGLAASLSQTGDGNVLLVDMNEEQGAAQQFYKGKPGCGLEVALESGTMQSAQVEGNLYVASERPGAGGKIQRVLPGRLATLMPKLKASEYDYIIFDMPPVTQTSMTSRLSGLMDMVLLVIESEKTNQDVVKRATALLAESKATVSTVLNKTRSYVPARLHQENLSDS